MPAEDPSAKPPAKPAHKQAQLDRRAAALRANLLKRKEQARKREEEGAKPLRDDR